MIPRAVNILRNGGLVAFATETVYGLGADATNPAAVRRIFAAKGRPITNPLIVHVADVEIAKRYVRDWPECADQLARQFWPGPLTLVLPKSPSIPDIVTAGLPTVGVRMPSHPIALQLIEAAGVPIAAPSANRFMELSPTTAAHVLEAFGERVPVLDGGPCQVGIESTVVAIADGIITLLRPGMISLGEMEQVSDVGSGSHPAPGMHARHYSPRTRLFIVQSPEDLPDRHGAYLWRRKSGLTARSVRMPLPPAAYAQRLYGALHELDGQGWPWIAVEALPEKKEWAAIRDRLHRAASGG
jgi:L-threonylcarbamoyladenylate synthase